MINRLNIILLLLAFCFFTLKSQEKRLIVNKLNSNIGLSSNLISGALQGKNGFIWIATNVGLNRFDGVSVKQYVHVPGDSLSIPSNKIKVIGLDGNDQIWIGSGKGISRFDYDSENFFNYGLYEKKYGIPAAKVDKIIFDNNNFMWFTQNDLTTLYLFDTQHEKIIFNSSVHQNKNLTLPKNEYKLRFIDSENRLWLICEREVYCLAYNQDSVYTAFNFKGNYKENIAFAPNPTFIFESSDSNVYVANHGLFKFDLKNTEKGLNYINIFDHDIPDSDLDFLISSIQEDHNNNLWIGTKNHGLIKFNPGKSSKIILPLTDEKKRKSIEKIEIDVEGHLWIFTDDGVIGKYLPDENYIYLYDKNPGNQYAFSSISVPNSFNKQIFIDNSGTHWLNTTISGLNFFNLDKSQFELYQHNEYNENSMASNKVWAITEDHAQRLWIGAGGVNVYNPRTGEFRLFNEKYSPELKYVQGDILAIREIYKNNFLVSASGRLIWLEYKNENLQFINDFFPGKSKNNSLVSWAPFYIFVDSENLIWIGTRNGISKMEIVDHSEKKVQFTNYVSNKHDPYSLTNNRIWYFYEDLRGRIWVVTDENVCVFNKRSNRFKNITIDLLHQSKNQYYPRSILEQPGGIYWIATEGFGLIKYIESTDKFDVYNTSNNLPSDYLYSVLNDKTGSLWISSVSGLIHFDPNSLEIELYTKNNGLQDNQFIAGSYHKSKIDGKMYFGGNNGLNAFYPEDIHPSKLSPPIVFTDLKIFNKSIDPLDKQNGRVILQKNINSVGQITLGYNERSFAIEFAALDYAAPRNIRYKFWLEGFENHKNEVSFLNARATYAGLPPGHYVLHVQSTNSDGYWQNNERKLNLRILPPWWLTWWALLLYISFLVFISATVMRIIYVRQQLKNTVSIEKIKTLKAQEIEKMKTRFFTNISHELRSPLTLIISPVQKLRAMNIKDEMIQYYYDIIYQNSKRLLRLVNQILDFSKLEAGHLKLQIQHQNFRHAMNEIVKVYGQIILDRNIDFNFIYRASDDMAWFDYDKLEKIISNLLSNAIKFTPEGEKIEVIVEDLPSDLPDALKAYKIIIKNYGVSIPISVLNKLFDRYFHYDNELNKLNKGMGLGLAIAKKLVELHKGSVGVESYPDQYTCFYLTICVDRNGFEDKAFATSNSVTNQFISNNPDQKILVKEKVDHSKTSNSGKSSKKIILIVEDEPQLLHFLEYELSDEYQTLTALNGKEGQKKAMEKLPDMIITDVMMPDMDGFQLCQELKQNERTSHIPIIIITAKTSNEDEQTGLQMGADDYILKPFSIQNLSLKIHNIFKSRHILQQKLSGYADVKPSDIEINSLDRKIINKATSIVEEYISDTDFDVEKFSKEMAMSKTVLFNKLKALTGLSATGFINTIRLKRASQLLQDGQLRVTEVSSMVGFKSRNYFTQRFTEYFNCSPSEYKRKNIPLH